MAVFTTNKEVYTPCFKKHIHSSKFLTLFDIAKQLSCPPHLTNVSTLPCKTYRSSFVAVHYKHALFCDKKLRSTIH